jgi:hypothetical protein
LKGEGGGAAAAAGWLAGCCCDCRQRLWMGEQPHWLKIWNMNWLRREPVWANLELFGRSSSRS